MPSTEPSTKCCRSRLTPAERRAAYAVTPLLAECPAIARFLASLACPVMSARLLNLRCGAVIKAHRDAELAFEKGEARLHVPIVTNPGVEFVIDGERVAMETGTCRYINANLIIASPTTAIPIASTWSLIAA